MLCITEIFVGSLVSANRRAFAVVRLDSSTDEGAAPLEYIVNGGLSGSQTFTATFRVNTGTAQVYGNPSIPMFMYLEDMGPV